MAAVVAGVLAGVVLPGVARSAGFTNLTTYTGTYTFEQDVVAQVDQPEGDRTRQMYRFTVFDCDSVTLQPGHLYTNRGSRYIAARGTYIAVHTQGSGSAGGLPTTTARCATASVLSPVENVSTSSHLFTVPVSENPAVEVGWELPDEGTMSQTAWLQSS